MKNKKNYDSTNSKNIDPNTVRGFGEEWTRFSQDLLSQKELEGLFSRYFSIFPWEKLSDEAVRFDMGFGGEPWQNLWPQG